ncbi:MAG: MBOAT family protein [Planctomycetota bacterium]|nr:MBOAT family protein [Planctomycetota bacterium]
MSFASSPYLLFLALVLAAFPFLPRRGRVWGMLLASYLFYFGQQPLHILALFLSTLLDFGVGLALARSTEPRARLRWLLLSLVVNVGALVGFKYTGFLAETWNLTGEHLGLALPVPDWALPLGISFYTFQTIGYTIDVYRGRIEACRSLADYGLYVAFFPQLISGPIERAEHLLPQLRNMQPPTSGNLSVGLRRMLWGLFKKVVLADRFRPLVLGNLADPGGLDSMTLGANSLGLLALLYLDFSAYTDLARGSARLFGVELVQNFDRPFAATSPADFTRRWHMSLIRWIEVYLYAPLLRGRLTHAKIWGTNTLLIGLFGLWHGPFASYLIGGVCLGACISVQQSLRLWAHQQRRRPKPLGPAAALAGWALTMAIWSLFVVALFAPDSGQAGAYYAALFTPSLPSAGQLPGLATAFALMALALGVHLAAGRMDLDRAWFRLPRALRPALLLLGAWGIARFAAPASEAFIYFRF